MTLYWKETIFFAQSFQPPFYKRKIYLFTIILKKSRNIIIFVACLVVLGSHGEGAAIEDITKNTRCKGVIEYCNLL